MPYLLPADLAVAPGAEEIAQIAVPAGASVVSTDLMFLVLTGSDVSEYPADQVAAAQSGLVRVEQAIAAQTEVIDGYLRKRYPTLPDPLPGIVTVWARDLVRWDLHQNLITDESKHPVAIRANRALKMLELTRDGKFSLGANDPVETSTAGSVEVDAPDRVFNDEQFRGFA